MLAIGDDRTDEDLFAALPPDAITIRVGPGPTRARFRLEGVAARAIAAALAGRGRGSPITARQPPGLGGALLHRALGTLAYYGMRACSSCTSSTRTTGGLGWTQESASRLYGWFIGLAYLTPVAGGWLADRFIGTRRSLAGRRSWFSLGHFSLALGRSCPSTPGWARSCVGIGFFKPNVHTMVGQLYQAGDPGRDPGFTLYYMGINLGALFGPLVCAWLAARYGWSYGFAAAGTAMLIGLAVLSLGPRHLAFRGVGLPPAGRRGRLPCHTPPDASRTGPASWRSGSSRFSWWSSGWRSNRRAHPLNVFAAHRTDRW